MNIFATHPDPALSAHDLADQHVVKMCCETAQILSTALILRGEADGLALYKPTHPHHPCVVWAAASLDNLWWLARHGLALCKEYTLRFDKRHKSRDIIDEVFVGLCVVVPVGRAFSPPSAFHLAMPDEFKSDDPHAAYRDYLRAKYAAWTAESKQPGSRVRAPKWTRCSPPGWMS